MLQFNKWRFNDFNNAVFTVLLLYKLRGIHVL